MSLLYGKEGRAREGRLQFEASGSSAADAAAAAAADGYGEAAEPPRTANNPQYTSTDPKHAVIIDFLEGLESIERQRCRPGMGTERSIYPTDCHGTLDHALTLPFTAEEAAAAEAAAADPTQRSLRDRQLRHISFVDVAAPSASSTAACNTGVTIPAEPAWAPMPWRSIVHLDLSRNELWLLPGLGALTGLKCFNLSRNWFQELPASLAALTQLEHLDASYNILRSTPEALQLEVMRQLPKLMYLDLQFNRRCGKLRLRERILELLPQLDAHAPLPDADEVGMGAGTGGADSAGAGTAAAAAASGGTLKITTTWIPGGATAKGAFVGDSAADRDASLLRSQLEPRGTAALRRRLAIDFGEPATDPCTVHRADVMERLLAAYAHDGKIMDAAAATACTANGGGGGGMTHSTSSGRRVVRVEGTLLGAELREGLLAELKGWAYGKTFTGEHRERLSIKAESYMILMGPGAFDSLAAINTRKGRTAAEKLGKHQGLWDAAQAAMVSVDPEFASKYTSCAFTHCFEGSPHIDKQNLGPFYGIALGDFPDGTGGIRVECSARVVAEVNTKNRLGKVDGRNPHWVAPYDRENYERFSVIYYITKGEPASIGPAIFSLPTVAGVGAAGGASGGAAAGTSTSSGTGTVGAGT